MLVDELQHSRMSDKVAIVVVGYNRIISISRLLNSLLNAQYNNRIVPLVISIDCSDDIQLYQYVNSFSWPYGPKFVNIQQKRLGLKKHIYQCADLTKYFKAIILLEDDIVVGPAFYSFVAKALEKYGNDSRIAQISLYKNEMNGYVGYPFDNAQDGHDVFLMQDVSTWGQCWTRSMWESFILWRDSHTENYILDIDIPETIKGWTRAWSKYYNAYVVDTNRYVLYPNISLTTNFSDAGEHGGDNNSIVQVNLLQNDKEYSFGEFDKLVRYDIYFNNEEIYSWLELDKNELCLDLYGFNDNVNKKRYILSVRHLPYKIVKTYALNMRPIELNIKLCVHGTGIYLYDTNFIESNRNRFSDYEITHYYLKGFNTRRLLRYVLLYYLRAIKNKFLRCKKY